MPFVNLDQMRACFAKKDPKWNCKKWAKETPNIKHLPKEKKQQGGLWSTNKKGFVDSTLQANKNLDFVDRLYNGTQSIQVPGQPFPSTHLMSYDPASRRVFPEVVNQNGKLKYLGRGDTPYDYADRTGEYIQFKTPEQAAWFSNSPNSSTGYKMGTGVLSNIEHGKPSIKRQQGGYSTQGYKQNSPDRNNPFNIIPSSNITMKNVTHPVVGIDSTGFKQLMVPGRDYKFNSNRVLEIPIKQRGGNISESTANHIFIPKQFQPIFGKNDTLNSTSSFNTDKRTQNQVVKDRSKYANSLLTKASAIGELFPATRIPATALGLILGADAVVNDVQTNNMDELPLDLAGMLPGIPLKSAMKLPAKQAAKVLRAKAILNIPKIAGTAGDLTDNFKDLGVRQEGGTIPRINREYNQSPELNNLQPLQFNPLLPNTPREKSDPNLSYVPLFANSIALALANRVANSRERNYQMTNLANPLNYIPETNNTNDYVNYGTPTYQEGGEVDPEDLQDEDFLFGDDSAPAATPQEQEAPAPEEQPVEEEEPTIPLDESSLPMETGFDGTGMEEGAMARASGEGTASSRELQATDYLIQKGLPEHVAAGIVGNLKQESDLNPNAVQRGGNGRGIAQWDARDRFQDLKRFAAQTGRPHNDLYTQLDYLLHEADSRGDLSKIKAAANPSEAAYLFAKHFERPKTIEQVRMRNAERIFKNRRP